VDGGYVDAGSCSAANCPAGCCKGVNCVGYANETALTCGQGGAACAPC